jgi:phage terminase large subunit-like protein
MRIRIDWQALEALPKREREQARSLLEEYERALKANPLEGYVPHTKQEIFHYSRAPAKCFYGGNRSGKTTAGILDDLIQTVDDSVVPDHLKPYKWGRPPFYCRIVTPDFTSTMEGVVFQKLRDWTPRGQLIGDSWDRAYEKQHRRLNFKNGSWFDFMTFEQDLDKFGGVALHRVHYDEEPPKLIRQECQFRLLDFAGDELFTMTPLKGMSWMFEEFYDPWERGVLEDASVVLVDMDDNPYLDERTKQRVLAGLSREERAARKSGRFVHFAGMVYPEFNRATHVTPSAAVPENATVVGAIDPGTRHMAAVVWAYLGTNDDLVIFEELGLPEMTVAQVCKRIRLVEAKHQLHINAYIIDPAARNTSHQTGR